MNLKCDASISLESRQSANACQSGRDGFAVCDEVRWVDGFFEMEFPRVPFPSRRIFAVAGEAILRSLVLRHHERLYETPLRALFPADRQRFLAAVTRAADYAVETCGGPNYFTSSRGKPCMRKRHYPFTIDEPAREIWLRQLWLAFDDVGFPAQIRQEYWEWVEPFSIRMINRRTQRAPPQRYAFADVTRTLLQVGVTGAPWHHREDARQESAAALGLREAHQNERKVLQHLAHVE